MQLLLHQPMSRHHHSTSTEAIATTQSGPLDHYRRRRRRFRPYRHRRHLHRRRCRRFHLKPLPPPHPPFSYDYQDRFHSQLLPFLCLLQLAIIEAAREMGF